MLHNYQQRQHPRQPRPRTDEEAILGEVGLESYRDRRRQTRWLGSDRPSWKVFQALCSF